MTTYSFEDVVKQNACFYLLFSAILVIIQFVIACKAFTDIPHI